LRVADASFIFGAWLEHLSPFSAWVGPVRVLLVILCCGLAMGLIAFSQIGQVSASSSQLPFDFSKPYALVVGESGHLFIFDGHQLFQFPTSTTFDLNHVRWRHDGAYALAVGDNNTLLKITVSNDIVSVQPIPTPLSNSTTLQSITWKADDSSAIITGPWGKYLLFDGQKTTTIPSPVNNRTIFASAWSPTTNLAIVAGQNDTIGEFNGTRTHIFDPPLTNCTSPRCSLFAVGWNPSGSYALVGGENATLYEYQQGSLTKQNTAVLFEAYPHVIRSIAFNLNNGIGLISGRLGLTVIATQTKCEYNIFYNANTVCLSYKRIQYYTALNGTAIDLHKIGHFYDAGWMPGTQDAYAVGPALKSCSPQDTACIASGWTIARITSSDVALLSQDTYASFSLRSIDWQPTVRASNPQMFTWYLIASGSIGVAAIVLVTKRKTLKEWLGYSHPIASR
jgi:hypothetical protein